MILKVLLLSIVILAIGFVGFAVNIIFKKNGKFPDSHVGNNAGLKKHGVYCATTQDKLEQFEVKKARRKEQLKNKYKDLKPL